MGKWLLWIAAGVVIFITFIGAAALNDAKGDEIVAQSIVSPVGDAP
jgi:hypothetical protein